MSKIKEDIDDIDSFLLEGKVKKAFSKFLSISNGSNIYNSFLMPLYQDYLEYREDKLAGIDVRGKLADITQRFMNIFEEFKTSTTLQTTTLSSFAQDPVYELLCNLNFKHQAEYFDELTTGNQCLIPFVIRAQPNYGQKWLYNRLIHYYARKNPNTHIPLVIELDTMSLDFEGLVDHLGNELKINNYHSSLSLTKRQTKVKNALTKKIATGCQFIVFNNAYQFIHSNDFTDFYKFLKYLYNEVDGLDSNYKCICLFVEQAPHQYTHQQYCVLSKQMSSVDARRLEELKFIDLDEHQPISADDFKYFYKKAGITIQDQLKCYWDDISQMKNLLQQCDNGNPEKLIPLICKKIGIDFKEYENKWLKY